MLFVSRIYVWSPSLPDVFSLLSPPCQVSSLPLICEVVYQQVLRAEDHWLFSSSVSRSFMGVLCIIPRGSLQYKCSRVRNARVCVYMFSLFISLCIILVGSFQYNCSRERNARVCLYEFVSFISHPHWVALSWVVSLHHFWWVASIQVFSWAKCPSSLV